MFLVVDGIFLHFVPPIIPLEIAHDKHRMTSKEHETGDKQIKCGGKGLTGRFGAEGVLLPTSSTSGITVSGLSASGAWTGCLMSAAASSSFIDATAQQAGRSPSKRGFTMCLPGPFTALGFQVLPRDTRRALPLRVAMTRAHLGEGPSEIQCTYFNK